VAFFLLTASPVFTGESVLEICMKHVQAEPEPPSARVGRPIGPALESLILRCLAKSQADRPADAAVLLRELEELLPAGHWTQDDAAAWWAANGAQLKARPPQSPAPTQHDKTPSVPGQATVAYDMK
jgi:serine/threonine-protein kinase